MDARYRLQDRYDRTSGRVHLNGNHALVRLLLEQRRRDRDSGHGTSGYVSGYRGSPLGGLDLELAGLQKYLDGADLRFEPGVNEELAATAIWGTQQASLMADRQCDGVFAMWYGKGPGVDRSGDALKHGNMAGVAPLGGVLVVAGDDPGAKSSSLAHQSEPALVAAQMPVVAPATHQDVLHLGIHAYALSRVSGCWVGFKVFTDLMDSSASVDVDIPPSGIRSPATSLGPQDYVNWSTAPLAMEQSLMERRLPLAQEYWRLNELDRIEYPSHRRLGIAAAGRSYVELREALQRMGLDEAGLEAIGLRLYRVGMTWPLDPVRALEFSSDLDDVLVIEEKAPLIEQQLTRYLYALRDRPRLAGKHDADGRALVPEVGELTADELKPVLVRWLARTAPEWQAPAERIDRELTLLPGKRQATFCAGCPHNLSTTVPQGSFALGGIGCHGMAVDMEERQTASFTQMGGEGANWIGMAPYVGDDHIFQNIGDGTFYHSGIMAVRAAIAAGVNITYKVLANGAVAMTGGQPIEGEPQDGAELVPEIVRQLSALGVRRVVVLNDGSHTYPRGAIPSGVDVLHRDRLEEVQRELRATPGVTAIVFDQFCAAEARRLRKRGKLPTPSTRAVINERVCEGCGDCNHVSNCIAVEPVETRFGRKRHINQSSCNLDLSCTNGYCPSFVTVRGGVLQSGSDADSTELDRLIDACPEPPPVREWSNVLVTGIGGTGISTTGAVLGMAAHLEEKEVSVLNQTGLAQKNGPVSSHVRIGPTGSDVFAPRLGAASVDVLLAADLVTTSDAKLLSRLSDTRTHAVLDVAMAPTADFTVDPDVDLSAQPYLEAVRARCHGAAVHPFQSLADRFLGSTAEANFVLVGYALQQGTLGVGTEALLRALELNGAAVETNKRALGLGRLLAARPHELADAAEPSRDDAEDEDATEVAADREAELVRYQNERYAVRYRELVDSALAWDLRQGGDGRFAKAVAAYFFKLMAYKDEYEVARLYVDGQFRRQMRQEFASYDSISLNLAPQRFFPKSPRTGRPRKVAIPGRLGMAALRVLAALRPLRGGPLDVFGHTDHRRRERALVGKYESNISEVIATADGTSYDLAVELASIPEHIRGFGDIKDASIDAAAVTEAQLLDRLRGNLAAVSGPGPTTERDDRHG